MNAFAGNGLEYHGGAHSPQALPEPAPQQQAGLRNWMHAAGATTIVVVLQLLLRVMLTLRKWNY